MTQVGQSCSDSLRIAKSYDGIGGYKIGSEVGECGGSRGLSGPRVNFSAHKPADAVICPRRNATRSYDVMEANSEQVRNGQAEGISSGLAKP